jgi:hypothetical protein
VLDEEQPALGAERIPSTVDGEFSRCGGR